jgi:hypothetical protein
MNDSLVRARVQDLIKAGVVPCDDPEKVWAGRGTGTHCVGCGEPIQASDVEYEVVLDGSVFRVHRDCFIVWREECGGARPF